MLLDYLTEFLANESNRIVFCVAVLFGLMVIDIITGALKAAWFTNDFTISRLRQGIALKFSEMLLIIAAVPAIVAYLDNQVASYTIIIPVLGWFAYGEFKSILNNCREMGGDPIVYEKFLDLFKSKND